MPNFIFEPVARPNKNDLTVLRNGLQAYNKTFIGKYVEKEIAAFVKNKNGNVIGGIYGELTVGW